MSETAVVTGGDAETPAKKPFRGFTAWSWGFVAWVVVTALVTCYLFSSPGGDLFVLVVLGVVWLGLGAVWTAWFLLELARAVRRRSFDRSRWAGLVVSALVVVTTAGLVVTDSPGNVRFQLARSDMTAHAKTVAPLPVDADGEVVPEALGSRPSKCFVGMCFEYIENVGGTVYYSQSTGIFDQAGFAYSPDSPPRSVAAGGFVSESASLGDGWYRFYVND